MAPPLADFFRRSDAGRRPELLPLRYHRMQANAFAFFRGSAPLFYQEYGRDARLRNSPTAWLCGDAHVENFGSYRGGNGLVYFDANDFDEAVRGPLLWDVARLAVSVLLAGAYLGLSPAQRQAAARSALTAYAATLATGKPLLLERETAKGVVRQFMKTVARRRRRDLLRAWARRRHGWHLRPQAALCVLPAAERKRVLWAFEAWRREQADPPCGPALDVAQRVAGVGSLGVPRYIVLAKHRSRKRPLLLDLKRALPAASQGTRVAQPRWPSEAQRVAQAQTWLQAVPPALLQAVMLDGQPFVLRALQPVADKLDFGHLNHNKATFRAALPDLAQLLAWAHLRAAGRCGAATPDVLQAYGGTAEHWLEGVLRFADAAVKEVKKDFRAFRTACRTGALPTAPKPLKAA